MRRGETDSKIKFFDHISCVTIPLILIKFQMEEQGRIEDVLMIMGRGETEF